MKLDRLDKGNGKICESILRSLPDWFGIEDAIVDYIKKSKEMPMIVAYDGESPVGFISLKRHSPFSSEIYVMGVSPEYHRKGLGKVLVQESEKYLLESGFEFLQVKTLDSSRECEAYRKTRLFYKSLGFKELEVFSTLWGEENPCLMLIKNLK